MKSFALALAAATVSAQTTNVATNNECWNGEGGRYKGSCSDVYFFTCDEYVIDPAAACNIFTFSDSRVTWLGSDISLVYWSFYANAGFTGGDATSADFAQDGNGGCYPIDSIPTQYTNGLVMNYTGGMCGFKYQVTNGNADFDNKFKVLKDSAATIMASSVVAIAAVLAF
jgi:hypothetical protein